MSTRATAWHSRPEAGQAWALKIVEWVATVFGRRAVHLFVAPVALYYLFRRPTERRASQLFLQRALGREASLFEVARHFHTFACVAVDRVFLLSKQKSIPIDVTYREPLVDNLQESEACILLGAHLGSFEVCRNVGASYLDRRLRLLLDRAVNRRIIERLERIDPSFARGIIDASGDGLAVILRIGECLRAGDWIGWLGDRHREGERTLSVPFMGFPARWPTSPFLVAHMFKVPVFLVIGVLDRGTYRIFVEKIVDHRAELQVDRDIFVRSNLEKYVSRLEAHARQWPFNWFNFHDVWHS